jgi:hypothetical protein
MKTAFAAFAAMLTASVAGAAPKVAPTSLVAQSAAQAAPRRAHTTCARYRSDAETAAPHAAFDTRLKARSWGAVPASLRRLPPDARLCGADSHGQAVIASPLYGKELESFYAPLFAKLAFEPLACTVDRGQTQCKTRHGRDIGILVTDASQQIFVLAYVKRERPRTPG